MFQPLDGDKSADGEDGGDPDLWHKVQDRQKAQGGHKAQGRYKAQGGRKARPLRQMLCSYVQAPKDYELLRYALEEESLPHPMEEHIITCNICRKQLEGLMSVNASLLRKLYRSRCPDVDILARYSAGLASLNEGLSVLYHLQTCPLCAQELQEMRDILEDDLF